MLTAFDHLHAKYRDIGPKLEIEQLTILGGHANNHLLHIRPIHEPLSRVQPHRTPRERRERLLVRLIVKAPALPRGGKNYSKRRHAIQDTGCRSLDARCWPNMNCVGLVALATSARCDKQLFNDR